MRNPLWILGPAEQCQFGIFVGQYISKAAAEAQVTGSRYAGTSARPTVGDQEEG